MKFKEGQIITIGKEKYDVLKIFHDIDWWDSNKNEIIGEYTAIELHRIGNFALHPTHLMKLYYNKKDEAVLFLHFYLFQFYNYFIFQTKHSSSLSRFFNFL